MFERFSDEARRTVVRALVEARLLGHGYVGTEHTVIALASAGETATASALASEGVTLERARVAVADVVGPDAPANAWDEGPYTARARHTFELSLREAFGLDHHYVANGHLLLGLLRLGQGNGVRVLESLGVDLTGLRHKVAAGIDSEGPPSPPLDRRVAISTGHRLNIKPPAEVDLRDDPSGTRGTGAPAHAAPSAAATVATGTPGQPPEPRAPQPHTCSFCEEPLGHSDRFVAGTTARICVECVRASARLLGVMDALRQDFTLVFDNAGRTATLSLGMSPAASG
jgi:hypothetical protein